MFNLSPDWINWLAAAAPFAGHTRKGDGGRNGGDGPPPYTPDVRRIMETLIPAAVVGAIVLWGSVQVISKDIENCQERMVRMELTLDRIHSDLYGPRWEMIPRQDMPPPSTQGLRHPLSFLIQF